MAARACVSVDDRSTVASTPQVAHETVQDKTEIAHLRLLEEITRHKNVCFAEELITFVATTRLKMPNASIARRKDTLLQCVD